MSGGNGGVIGAANIPTSVAASGVWRPSEIARILQRAVSNEVVWPTAQDPNFSSVIGLYHYKNWRSDGSLLDSSAAGHHLPPTISGSNSGPTLFTGAKFGSASLASGLAGTSLGWHLAHSDYNLGTGDFTIEGWFNFTGTGDSCMLFDFRASDANGSTNGPAVIRLNTGKVVYRPFNVASGNTTITGGTTTTAAAWHHIHVTRASGVTYLGMDGAQEGSDYSDSTNYAGGTFWLGELAGDPTNLIMKGRIQEVRLTKGVARYSRTYTVPVSPFPDY